MDKLQELESRLAAVEAALSGLGHGGTLENVQRDIDRAANHARKEQQATDTAAVTAEAAEPAEPKAPKHRSHH